HSSGRAIGRGRADREDPQGQGPLDQQAQPADPAHRNAGRPEPAGPERHPDRHQQVADRAGAAPLPGFSGTAAATSGSQRRTRPDPPTAASAPPEEPRPARLPRAARPTSGRPAAASTDPPHRPPPAPDRRTSAAFPWNPGGPPSPAAPKRFPPATAR